LILTTYWRLRVHNYRYAITSCVTLKTRVARLRRLRRFGRLRVLNYRYAITRCVALIAIFARLRRLRVLNYRYAITVLIRNGTFGANRGVFRRDRTQAFIRMLGFIYNVAAVPSAGNFSSW
jgi:hypothetical protein